MLSKKIKSSLISAFVIFNLSSCAIYNTDLDRKIGAQNSQQIALQMGLYQTQPISEYVQSVGQRLVNELENPEFSFQFEIVDDAVPNAFALPGGYIYISRGLLALMKTEDELANVLAHEIIHVTERHSIKQIRSGILPSLIELPGNLVGGILNENLGNLINVPISAGNDLLLSGYGRGHETESDEKGIVLAAKAGYDPQQMTNILVRLNSAVELSTKQKTEKSYFDSHPYTPDRVAHINSLVNRIAPNVINHKHTDFIQNIDGLLYGENPANGYFVQQQFLHPDMGFVIDFPKNWTLHNQPQAVVAVEKSQNSFVALSTVNNNKNAFENVRAFQQQVKKDTGKQLDYSTISFAWGGTGYVLNFESKQQKRTTTIELFWLDLNGLTYQVASMAIEQFKQQATLSSQSLRPMLKSEKDNVTQQVIKVVKGEQGDSLETIARRLNSVADIEYLRLINELNKQEQLSEKQKIKVIVVQPYIASKH